MKLPVIAFVALAAAGCGPERIDPERAAREAEAIRAFGEPLAAPETPVILHPAVPAESHDRRPVGLERTVLVSPDASRPETLFYRGLELAVGPEHTVFVLEKLGARLQAFDEDGEFLARVDDGAGFGPGQLGEGSGRIATSDRFLYYVSEPNRLVTWTLDGVPVSTRSLQLRTSNLFSLGAAADGLLAGTWRKRQGDRSMTAIGTIAEDGRVSELMSRAIHPRRSVVPEPEVALAVSPDGVGYLTSSDRYEVLAIDLATGDEQWLLRVDWAAIDLTRAHRSDIEAAVAARRATDDNPGGDPRPSGPVELDLPPRYPILSIPPHLVEWSGALEPVRIDGHGRIYVFPYVVSPEHGVPYPVDVYDRNGEFIGAGLMPRITWHAARDDFVYGFEADENEERVLVRYRIVLPF